MNPRSRLVYHHQTNRKNYIQNIISGMRDELFKK
jgi:hypothetical protein